MTEQEKEILEEEPDTVADSDVSDSEEAMADSEDTAADSDAEDTEEVPEGEEPMTWAEKKAAKKQAKADKKADASKEKIAELEDKVKRQLAEFENFRNRTEKEKQAMFETGAKSVIEKILPVIDNFERGFATVEEADAGTLS